MQQAPSPGARQPQYLRRAKSEAGPTALGEAAGRSGQQQAMSNQQRDVQQQPSRSEAASYTQQQRGQQGPSRPRAVSSNQVTVQMGNQVYNPGGEDLPQPRIISPGGSSRAQAGRKSRFFEETDKVDDDGALTGRASN